MKKFNLVGDTFTHLTNGNKGYSVHGKVSKYIEWVKEGGEGTFYLDETINNGISDGREGPKYLWLLESKFIKQGLVESIIENRQLVEDNMILSLLMIKDFFLLVTSISGFLLKDFGSKTLRFVRNQK